MEECGPLVVVKVSWKNGRRRRGNVAGLQLIVLAGTASAVATEPEISARPRCSQCFPGRSSDCEGATRGEVVSWGRGSAAPGRPYSALGRSCESLTSRARSPTLVLLNKTITRRRWGGHGGSGEGLSLCHSATGIDVWREGRSTNN